MLSKNCLLSVVLTVLAGATEAREMGHYVPGVANIRDLFVPAAPGFYYEQYNVYYNTDTYRDRHGDSRNSFDLGSNEIELDADVDALALVPQFIWVTKKKVLTGDYAFYIAPSVARNSVASQLSGLENRLDVDTDGSGLGDTFIQPLWLGWRDTHYDLSLGVGLYLPTGKYDADDDDNVGLGFFTGQVQLAGYYYLDETQASAFMLAATYEAHGEKEDTDVTPGDHVTVEYGFSQYLSERLEIGIAGFSQWQVERDSHPTGPLALDPNAKSEVHGIGAQIAYWASPQLNVSFKYMKEYNAKARFEGDWFSLNITWIPTPLF
jgi:hypothetical protein